MVTWHAMRKPIDATNEPISIAGERIAKVRSGSWNMKSAERPACGGTGYGRGGQR